VPAARYRAAGHDPGDRPDHADVLTGAVRRTGRPIWISGADVPSPLLRTGLAIPARSGGRVLAVLSFYATVVEDPADPLIALLSGIGAHIAEFLERRRAEELTLALARSKDEYLALIGHELRTPLTSITAYVEMLREADPATAAEELPGTLDVLSRNSTALRQIIDQLIDLAALDGGHAELARDAVDLAAVVRAAAEAVHPVAAAAGVAVSTDLCPGAIITGDGVRIRQMADQLLDNAVKHTLGAGRVTVALTRPDPAAAELTITDTGLGVPADERERLFAPFYRSQRTREHRSPGNGLGLTISRAIVEGHHGSIRLVPVAGPGSRVTVRLPVRPAGSPPRR
jgi:signal transduction histidine kinase